MGMYGNIRRTNVQRQQMVPLDAVRAIVNEITNPVKPEKLIEADGGAYRAYCYNIANKHS